MKTSMHVVLMSFCIMITVSFCSGCSNKVDATLDQYENTLIEGVDLDLRIHSGGKNREQAIEDGYEWVKKKEDLEEKLYKLNAEMTDAQKQRMQSLIKTGKL